MRRRVAEDLGAVAVAPEDAASAVAEASGGWGADVVIGAIGAEELEDASLELAAPGGGAAGSRDSPGARAPRSSPTPCTTRS
ncbi:hypothetical protein [Actinomyces bowdenii]|uniref:hypothetical protein n=1 Tax=Actinomyces bowdenii TaxID=131109 RepID=UPI001FD21DC1|nr:hypothetical protein [Actinomyces bowdenii]